MKKKRMAQGLPEDSEEPEPKKVKPEFDEGLAGQIQTLRDEALQVLIDQMQDGTEAIYRNIYGTQSEQGARFEEARAAKHQAEARERLAAAADLMRKKKESETIPMTGTGVYLDDLDPRY